MLIILLEVV